MWFASQAGEFVLLLRDLLFELRDSVFVCRHCAISSSARNRQSSHSQTRSECHEAREKSLALLLRAAFDCRYDGQFLIHQLRRLCLPRPYCRTQQDLAWFQRRGASQMIGLCTSPPVSSETLVLRP